MKFPKGGGGGSDIWEKLPKNPVFFLTGSLRHCFYMSWEVWSRVGWIISENSFVLRVYFMRFLNSTEWGRLIWIPMRYLGNGKLYTFKENGLKLLFSNFSNPTNYFLLRLTEQTYLKSKSKHIFNWRTETEMLDSILVSEFVFIFVALDKSNPNNNLMMRQAGLSMKSLCWLKITNY